MSAGNNSVAPASSEADVESSTGMPRMCEMTEQDSQLSAMLRRRGATAPQGAPPALGEKLKGEFRRHHIRRRRERNARILLVAACLVVSVMTYLKLRPRPSPRTSNVAAIREPVQTTPPRQSNVAVKQPKLNPAERKSVGKPASSQNRKKPEIGADRFVALPTFDFAIPIDHLELVRVDLPGRDLRLVGFPVSEEIADRRVVADVLLAQDGTPYALRLVQNSTIKEQ